MTAVTSEAGVKLGPLDGLTEASSTFNSKGVGQSSSSHLNIGGLSESKSSMFALGKGGLHSSESRSTEVNGFTVVGSDSHLDIGRNGNVSMGGHDTFLGHKMGYDISVNPIEGLQKGGAFIGRQARKISELAGRLTEILPKTGPIDKDVTRAAGDVIHGVQEAASHVPIEEITKIAGEISKHAGEIVRVAGHVSKAAIDVIPTVLSMIPK